jgi:uncharacterized protein YoxC
MSINFEEDLIFYNTSRISAFISDIPRKDRNFNDADSEFDPESMEYWEGVVLVAAPALVAALLTILIFTTRCCCRTCAGCMRCMGCLKKVERKYLPRPKWVVRIFLAIAIFVLLCVIYGYVANSQVSGGVDNVQEAMLDMDSLRNENVASALFVSDKVLELGQSASDLNTTITDIDQRYGAVSIPQSTLDALVQLSEAAEDAKDTIVQGIDTFKSIPIGQAVDEVEKYDTYRGYAQLGILSFLLLPYGMVSISLLINSPILVWNVGWVSVLCGVFGWVLSGLETSACLFIGDACVDPSGYLLSQVERLDSQEALDFASYYIVCAGKVNPLQPRLDLASTAINATREYTDVVSDFVDSISANISIPDLENLNNILQNVTSDVDDILSEVDSVIKTVFRCNRLHNQYVHTLNGICDEALSGFSALVVIQSIMAFCLWIVIYCGIKIYRYLSRKNLQRESRKDLKAEDTGIRGDFRGLFMGDLEEFPDDDDEDERASLRQPDAEWAKSARSIDQDPTPAPTVADEDSAGIEMQENDKM